MVQVWSHRKQSISHPMDIEPPGLISSHARTRRPGLCYDHTESEERSEHSQETSMDFQRWHQTHPGPAEDRRLGACMPTKEPSLDGAIMHPMPALLFGCCHSTKVVLTKRGGMTVSPKPWPFAKIWGCFKRQLKMLADWSMPKETAFLDSSQTCTTVFLSSSVIRRECTVPFPCCLLPSKRRWVRF